MTGAQALQIVLYQAFTGQKGCEEDRSTSLSYKYTERLISKVAYGDMAPVGVDFHLVDDDREAVVCEEVFKLFDGHIGDADVLHQAFIHNFFQSLPCALHQK